MAQQTTAQQIAAKLGNAGLTWRAGEESTLRDLCLRHRSKNETQKVDNHRSYRMSFDDGSAIVVCERGWDIEGSEKWSWKGMEEEAA